MKLKKNKYKYYIASLVIFLLSVISFVDYLNAYNLNFNYFGAKLVKSDSEKKVYKKKNGTIIHKFSDREEAFFKNKTRIIRYKNGKREIFTYDDVKIIIEFDGSVKYIYPDGKEKFISMDGKTPYGVDIKEIFQRVRRIGLIIDVIYSTKLSDDNINKYMKIFYKELVKQVRRRIYGFKTKEKHMKIVISNCRFGKTGYCRRENSNGVEIISYKSNIKDKAISVNYNDILSKRKYIKIASDVISEILK